MPSSRIWEALSEPYRLSISYQIQVAHVDAETTLDNVPVIDRFFGQGEPPRDGAQP